MNLNLLFDMCKWKIEGEDVEAVDEATTECHRPLTNKLSSSYWCDDCHDCTCLCNCESGRVKQPPMIRGTSSSNSKGRRGLTDQDYGH